MKTRPVKKRTPIDPAVVQLVRQLALGLIVFGVIGVLLTAVWYGTRYSGLTISTVTIETTSTIAVDPVKQKIEGVLQGTYWRFVPRRFAWWYPEAEILTVLEETERIKDISVTVVDSTNLLVTFSEYQPDALWCSTTDTANCLFMDNTGYAFAKAPALRGNSFVRYYSLQGELVTRTRPFTLEDYQATKDFIALLSESGWNVSTVEIDAVRDVFYTLVLGSELKATLTETPQKTFSYLSSIRQSEEFAHLEPGNFQYIDLRFGAKAFVNEELPVISAEADESIEPTSVAE